MSSLELWIGAVCFSLCMALIVHALLCPLSVNRESLSLSGWGLMWRMALQFVGIWIWFGTALPLLVWIFWLGDTNDWFYEWIWLVAAAIAAAVCLATTARLRAAPAKSSYARIQLIGSLLLLACWGGFALYLFSLEIEGTTPEGAAAQAITRLSPGLSEEFELVERQPDPDFDPQRCRSYWIVVDNEPRGQVTVCKYGYFWWTFASNSVFPTEGDDAESARARFRAETGVR